MNAIVFLGIVALFDLFVAILIRHDIMAYGIDRSPTTERLTSVAIPLSIVAVVVGIAHLSGVV